MFERLRGGIFCLRGEYDKSVYYLLEAIDALQKLPDRDAYRLQLAAACYDYGRVCRQRLDYAEACSHYKKALALIGEGTPCPGAVWIYVHYGRLPSPLGMTDAPALSSVRAALSANEPGSEAELRPLPPSVPITTRSTIILIRRPTV